MRTALRRRLLGGIAALCFPACGVAQAQVESDGAVGQAEGAESAQLAVQASDSPREDERGTGEVVVTGSRVVRDGYQAPTPTTIVGTEEIQKSAQVNLADYLNQLPQLSNSLSPTTNRNGLTSGASFLNLRGLGPNRTLVLLDGRRVAPSSVTGNVDFNLLPTGLTQRVDIVTGGASSAWGSDAVAGVVNVVLDKRLDGFRGEVLYGVTDRGDGRQFKANLSVGGRLFDDRLRLVASAEHNELDGIDSASSRDWYRGWNIINNPAFVAGGSEPRRLLRPGVGISRATPGGVVTAGPLANTQFNAQGQPIPFNPGFVSGILSLGGDGYLVGQDQQIATPVEWDTLFGRAEFEVADALTVFAEGSYADASSSYAARLYQRDGNIVVSGQNAYLDPALATRLTAAGQTSFSIGKIHRDLPIPTIASTRELSRGVLGVEGKLGGGWRYDAYYQHGRTRFDTTAINNPITANYNAAVDAVDEGLIRTGVRNGNVVCRSTITASDNGCVPFNVFGSGDIPVASQAYFLGIASQVTTIKQEVAAANLNGELFKLPAGPVLLAAGLEYREESYVARDPDPLSLVNAYFLGNYKPSAGSYDVKEAYGELVVPIVANRPFAKRVEISGAARITDYSTSGKVTTWKIGGSWEFGDDIRLRATYSRDIRAPNLNELFQAASTTNFVIVDPVNRQQYNTARILAGNTGLEPEIAKTFSVGAVVSPRFIPGLSVSVDYYEIDIDEAIFTPEIQVVIDQCQAGDADLCAAIDRNAQGLISSVRVLPQNVLSEKLRGIDLDASLRFDLGPGDVNVRALATHVFERSIDSFGTQTRFDGVAGDPLGIPKWRAQTSVSYRSGGLTATAIGRHVSGGVLNKAWGPADIDDNSVAGRTYFDLSASYDLPELGANKVQLFGVVQNVFDVDPSVAVATVGNAFASIGTNANFFDTIGRQFRLGVRIRR